MSKYQTIIDLTNPGCVTFPQLPVVIMAGTVFENEPTDRINELIKAGILQEVDGGQEPNKDNGQEPNADNGQGSIDFEALLAANVTLTLDTIKASHFTTEQLEAVAAYEAANKNRAGVLKGIQDLIGGVGHE